MTLITLLALLMGSADVDVKVSMLDGQSRSGQPIAITAAEVVLNENGTESRLPVADVMSIEWPSAGAPSADESQLVTLHDGSRLHGAEIVRTARDMSITTASFGSLTIDSAMIRSVRLQADNPAHRAQWNTFLKRESEKDLLIVAKRDGSGLDFLAGVVSAIGKEKVEFLLDGETVPVPAARVYGVVFAQVKVPGNLPPGKASLQISSKGGDIVAARSVTLQDNELSMETTWGQPLKVSLDQLQKIDLSGGRVQFLSDLEPIEERFEGVDPEGSLLAGLIDKEQQFQLFGPRRDTTMERQSRLRLRGREFAKGLCIHSRTEISWALDQQFASLDCIAGIDDEVAFNGKHAVALRIMGDEKVLFEQLIATTDEPLPLRIPLDGVSTLTILVDFGDSDSTCDWLDLADAKLILAKDKP
jgi:hypothetical protein